MAKYNGHRSWNAWNVSLWINNDEGLYKEAVRLVREKGHEKAARSMAADMTGGYTPDGAPYTLTSIREAIRGIDS